MKLATLRNGTRDGQLVVVNRSLTYFVPATDVATTMQRLLDRWTELAPVLKGRYDQLNAGALPETFPFTTSQAMAPLPRAYQWCDGSAYLSHAELVRKARNAEMPQFLYQDPMMYQGASDTFLGPNDDIEIADEAWGIDLEAEIAVITDDVPMGTTPADAAKHIRLVTIINDVSLRNLIPQELSKGFGFFHSKPSTAFAAVAVTPDELAPHWDGAKLNLPLISIVNGQELGQPNAGKDLDFDFPALIAHATKSRRLGAGTIIGSGTVSNRDLSAGSSCLAERRMLEVIDTGKASTPFLKFGDNVVIDMRDEHNASLFGPIDQQVVQYRSAKTS
jgi:fumarylacetoacetate (FAA) hydrolase